MASTMHVVFQSTESGYASCGRIWSRRKFLILLNYWL